MASHTYNVQFLSEDDTSDDTKMIQAEDFRVIGSAVVFYRHIKGDKANTHLFNLEDISSIELAEPTE